MRHYSRLAKKIVRRYMKSDILKGNINPVSEYRRLRNQFKACKYCYLRNKERYGKCRREVLKELDRCHNKRRHLRTKSNSSVNQTGKPLS